MKRFKLNPKQEILISEDHPLYAEILVATLVNQKLLPIVKKTLQKQGLFLSDKQYVKSSTHLEYGREIWYTSLTNSIPLTIKII